MQMDTLITQLLLAQVKCKMQKKMSYLLKVDTQEEQCSHKHKAFFQNSHSFWENRECP